LTKKPAANTSGARVHQTTNPGGRLEGRQFIKPEDFTQIDTTRYEDATISSSRVPQYKKYPTSMTCASILSDRRRCL
jgi:hypothetical protein